MATAASLTSQAAGSSPAAAASTRGNRLASDSRNLDGLRNAAAKDPKTAAREAATQFEALFMQQVLKSMRAASQSSGMLDNEASKLGTEMLDAQLATGSAGRPGGLADLIARQLERQMGVTPSSTPANSQLSSLRAHPAGGSTAATGSTAAAAAANGTAVAGAPGVPSKAVLGFVQQHGAAARSAEAASGIPASFMIAQAAHETGWGAKEIIGRDGTASNNLFGIKAGASWKGPTVDVTTTEYVNGQAQKVVQKFRAYASHAESFADYARLIGDSPRYAAVRAAGGDASAFAQGLQNAGYATDPAYASKLARVIQTTQRAQRAAG
ncbi:flagellar assembly peptidoglycan hydrolase FlgJ [Aquabacterium sp. OR-4]|uniref:flagellar assembly peptidoglycan hydrolase FlgJ n=1 Tax=Aquabacterium sp. OR-4 TaxID=2978127 RepID=UPI0021B32DC6|nr:flagellar assembly peptidoglycan hydrolase FlgJ [Aquabacterium sp. OR-4]MDT7836187.1 flagellar assembly peptidoglycan hydrolase FlgJ [Aquabacterium sp. OR-4]